MQQTTLDPEVEQHLREPPPGSAIEAARDFGVDLTLLIERLRLTPDERVRQLQQAMTTLSQIRGVAHGTQGRHPPHK